MELFLNSVPLLKSLSREEKLMLVDAVEEQVFPAGTRVITQASALSHSAWLLSAPAAKSILQYSYKTLYCVSLEKRGAG